jgi:predicted transcriptional regulator
LFERIASWPDEDIAILEEISREIEAERTGVYHPSAEELRAIDEGIEQLDRGEHVSEEDMKAFWKRWGVKAQ